MLRLTYKFRESAKEYYDKAHHIDGLIDALYQLEKYDELEGCIQRLGEKNPLLAKLGQMLASVGMFPLTKSRHSYNSYSITHSRNVRSSSSCFYKIG